MESPACKRWLTHKSLCCRIPVSGILVEIGVAKVGPATATLYAVDASPLTPMPCTAAL